MSIVVIAAKRTPIGSFMGSLKDISAVDLGVQAARAVLSCLPHEEVADVIVGNVLQSGAGMNPGRQVAIKAGLPATVPGQTINRVCGSGLQSVINAVQALKAGDGNLYIAGGTENMSRAPFLIQDVRAGYRLGNTELIDSILRDGLTDQFNHCHMGVTAENVASRWGITRTSQDALACESQRRAATAIAQGYFQTEIVPVEVRQRNGTIETFERDEHVRPDTTIEIIQGLRPVFKAEGGTVTVANASGLNDGAAFLSLATEEYAKANGLPILAEVMSYAVTGVEPEVMGIGPIRAVARALANARLHQEDIDLFEINEAFAATSLAVAQQLDLDMERVNVNGGSIALGHPIGASGARILVTLIHALRARKKELGIASLCIGGGMGIALIVRAR